MYTEQKTRLTAKKAELEERITRLTRDQRHVDEPVEKDFEEQASQRESDDVIDETLRASRIELQQINRALLRMAAGEYGVCSRCGADIGTGRLAAIPEATLCIKCAK
ncbi:MAG: TraR/DksA family transcriptional regulator [Pseudomonadota bacterium]